MCNASASRPAPAAHTHAARAHTHTHTHTTYRVSSRDAPRQARCDLNPHASSDYHCFGALDIKAATAGLFDRASNSSLAFYATMAPSWKISSNPAFRWSQQDAAKCPPATHAGQPDVFNFTMHVYPDDVEAL